MKKRLAFTYYSCWTNLCTVACSYYRWVTSLASLDRQTAKCFLDSGKVIPIQQIWQNHYVSLLLSTTFLFLSTTSKVTCERHKHLNYVIAKMQWESSGQLIIWTYVGFQEPLWDVGLNVPIAQPGEHTTVTIKCGASFNFHFCCGDMGRTLWPFARYSGWTWSRLFSKKLQTINPKRGVRKWNSCTMYLGEYPLMVKGLSNSTAFAFNCAMSLFLPLHQLDTFSLGIVVFPKNGQIPRKTVGFDCQNSLV